MTIFALEYAVKFVRGNGEWRLRNVSVKTEFMEYPDGSVIELVSILTDI